MLVSSDRIIMQLLMPPAMSLLMLWMGRNVLISTSRGGILTENRRRLLWSVFFVLLTFLYGMTFNRELRGNPFIAGGILVLVSAFIFWRIQKWRVSAEVVAGQTDQIRINSNLPVPRSDPASPPFGFRIRQWIVLIWAVFGIAGTLAAVLWKILRQANP